MYHTNDLAGCSLIPGDHDDEVTDTGSIAAVVLRGLCLCSTGLQGLLQFEPGPASVALVRAFR